MKGLLTDLRDLQRNLEFQSKLENASAPDQEAKARTFDPTTTGIVQTTFSTERFGSGIRQHKRAFGIGILGLIFLLAGVGYWFLAIGQSRATPISTIAVMPFVNASGSADVITPTRQ